MENESKLNNIEEKNLKEELIVKRNLLIGCTGSIAAIRLFEIIEKFKDEFNINVILTEKCIEILKSNNLYNRLEDFKKLHSIKVSLDKEEFIEWKENSKVTHIELRKWADLLLIAPLSANTLAKITNGLCDNLLTCVVRCWDFKKPVFFALAMNTYMYESFITEKQKNILIEDFKFIEIPSIEKRLACGDYGNGAIANTSTIYEIVKKHFK